ncbi:MAG: hypothetical protein MPK62_01910 [Alphaproteobacteria bacterium]|nr:hypothetical protein [Alphaproteobacteria bacterium]MDA8029889.1 hypothetical protein [Alphaproteobacteria bacterium]
MNKIRYKCINPICHKQILEPSKGFDEEIHLSDYYGKAHKTEDGIPTRRCHACGSDMALSFPKGNEYPTAYGKHPFGILHEELMKKRRGRR